MRSSDWSSDVCSSDLAGAVVVELLAVSETEFDESVVLDDADDGPDAVRVFLTPEQAREFSLRSERVSAAGRAPCPLCGAPSAAEGHVCISTQDRKNGMEGTSGSERDELIERHF